MSWTEGDARELKELRVVLADIRDVLIEATTPGLGTHARIETQPTRPLRMGDPCVEGDHVWHVQTLACACGATASSES